MKKTNDLWPVALLLSLAVLVSAAARRLPAAAPVLAPQDASHPVLVIDPGHGGADGGAVAPDGTKESSLNLAVALRTEAVCALLGLDSVMTRRTEDLAYPPEAETIHEKKVADSRARVALVNELGRPVLLSIHQNYYPGEQPSGAQALYGKGEGSRELAAMLEQNLSALPEIQARASAAVADSVYLLKNVGCPAILVECGFLSNPAELEKLKSEGYQKQLALVLAAGCSRFMFEGAG